MSALKGKFKPKNPKKYRGNCTEIYYRSGWELKYMMVLDHDPDVISWSSEEVVIPYISPLDGLIHRYFPDFFVEKKNSKGKIEKFIIEIKPHYQTVAPKNTERKTKRKYIKEVMTYGINTAKWEAAQNFCESRGWKFVKLTEKELGIVY